MRKEFESGKRGAGKLSLFLGVGLALTLFVAMTGTPAFAQTTIATGSIEGIVTDPTGAVVPRASVAVTSEATGQKTIVTASKAGFYNSGPLLPGSYLLRVEAKGFKTAERAVTVQVGVTSAANVTLQVGAASTVVSVTASPVQVNTEQSVVQGVMTRQQISDLPVNGRNFLDLAQLEPGVQIQDGTNFDPTKVGYSSISIGSRYGRTARIEVDGVDVSDETVGTTTEDIPASAIQEFNIEQSSLDPSTELTSSGAVNVTTRSGTHAYHGELFEFYRNNKIAAGLPTPPGFRAPFERSQFGGNFGGPVIRNKLFFFMDAERTVQSLAAPVTEAAPFQNFSGNFNAPFRDGEALGRVDYVAPHGIRLFYRFSYFKNKVASTFFTNSFQVYKNVDQTRQHVVGADFTTGNWTHSVRFSYLKFQNNIFDATRGTSLPFANFPVSLFVSSLDTGPNLLAPQETPQKDHQIKYDGSRVWGNHVIRYGVDYNHIQGGGFAKFFSIDPNVFSLGPPAESPLSNCGPGPVAASDPLCYPIDAAVIGNGQGFSTELPAFGFPIGGLGPDNRVGVYLGDSWKARRNLTFTYGVRWDRDTGRTDSDLPPVPGFNQVLPGTGGRVAQKDTNLAPQFGLAWDPTGSGKTAIRIGAGLFFENVIFNNVLFDRSFRLAKGNFLAFPAACFGGSALPVTFGPVGPDAGQALTIDSALGHTGPSICSESIGQAASPLAQFQSLYEGSFSTSVLGPNPNFAPSLLAQGFNVGTALDEGIFSPGYKTPRSFQFNVGLQRQIMRGLVVSADYIRNVNMHYLLGVDANRTGDVAFFNKSAALAAIAATNSSFGCATGPSGIACAIAHGATMDSYAGNGLTSPGNFGANCLQFLGYPCAFGGINPNIGQFYMLFPIGRSVYNALQVKVIGNMAHVAPGIRGLNFQFSYALSRFTNDGSLDQDFINFALSNRDPLAFSGPSSLDRRHQISFGGILDVPFGLQLSLISHFYSPPAATLQVPFTGDGLSQIFQTDFTGSGVDAGAGGLGPNAIPIPLPGTTAGNFERGVDGGNINTFINTYDNNAANAGCPPGIVGANCPTPAGQVLISNGLFTLAQLQTLGAVSPTVRLAPAGEIGLNWLKAFDLGVAWQYRIKERVTVKPSVMFFNLFNFANFNLVPPGAVASGLTGVLDGAPCSLNGTTRTGNPATDCPGNRVGVGTGVFSLGAPRQIQVGLKISF